MRRTRFLPQIRIRCSSAETRRCFAWTAPWPTASGCSSSSYANAFIPYLIPYYEEIVIVDPRYYYDDLDELIESEEISETLFLFNMNTFCTDDSLQQMLGR